MQKRRFSSDAATFIYLFVDDTTVMDVKSAHGTLNTPNDAFMECLRSFNLMDWQKMDHLLNCPFEPGQRV